MSDLSLNAYDAGLLNDYGAGNVEWWQDYIRAELDRAHAFYLAQMDDTDATRKLARMVELAGVLEAEAAGARLTANRYIPDCSVHHTFGTEAKIKSDAASRILAIVEE